MNRGDARTAMPSCLRARIYACGRGSICQVAKNAKLIVKLLEVVFSSFAKKKKYAKLRYQTLGDALTLHTVRNISASICMCMSFTRGMISWCLRSLVETDAAIVDKRLLFFNLGPGRASVDHRGTAGWWRASP